MNGPIQIEDRKGTARNWFETLQARLIGVIEDLERECPGPFAETREPGRFELTPWTRTDHGGAPGGGGRMAMLHGRVFEKMGAHASTVYGTFAPEFAKQIPGADADPRFWASGISVMAVSATTMGRPRARISDTPITRWPGLSSMTRRISSSAIEKLRVTPVTMASASPRATIAAAK